MSVPNLRDDPLLKSVIGTTENDKQMNPPKEQPKTSGAAGNAPGELSTAALTADVVKNLKVPLLAALVTYLLRSDEDRDKSTAERLKWPAGVAGITLLTQQLLSSPEGKAFIRDLLRK